MNTPRPVSRCGALLSVGVRGAAAGDPELEADLEVCAAAGVGSVVLFDVDVPRYRAALAAGAPDDEARAAAERNVRSPSQVEALCRYLRSRLGAELVILVDQEGGNVARLRPERGFADCLPSAADFARRPSAEQFDLARRQARTLASVGIDGNLAPVVDLGRRPAGPLAAKGRTFAGDPEAVTRCARIVVEGHRAEGVATCLKHFPGLGSADLDSHVARPRLGPDYDPDLELAPYRAFVTSTSGPDMIMAAHVIWPALDPDRPASASSAALTGILRDQWGFRGVVATDSLDMGGAGAEGSVPAAVASLVAGADLLMDAVNLGGPAEGVPHPALKLAEALTDAVESGALEGGWAEVDRRAHRVRELRRTTGR